MASTTETKPTGRRCRSGLICAGAVGALVALALGAVFAQGALSTHYDAWGNPGASLPWSAARWRALEHADRLSFNQWWYLMITDAETGFTFSVGIGGFRGDNTSGGWAKVKKGSAAAPAHEVPTLTVPFSHVEALPDTLNARVWRQQGDAEPALSIAALDENRVHIRARITDGAGAEVDVVLTRTYGVFAFGALNSTSGKADGSAEACDIANLPFAYASKAEGFIRIGGPFGAEARLDHTPRFRAYLESTWGCSFPQSAGKGADEAQYPWRWLWSVVPAEPAGGSASSGSSAVGLLPRGGRERGEVGLLVSNARMSVPIPVPQPLAAAAPGLAARLRVDIQGTFAFFDLPNRRVAGVNVTLFDGSRVAFPALKAAPAEVDALHAVWMELGEWAPFADEHGATQLPMLQVLHVRTSRYALSAVYRGTPDQYVRLAVRYTDRDGSKKVISDFRASFSQTFMRLAQRADAEPAHSAASAGAGGGHPRVEGPPEAALPAEYSDLLFEGFAAHNAAEFAFHAAFEEAVLDTAVHGRAAHGTVREEAAETAPQP